MLNPNKKIEDLIRLANDHYPDDMILTHWDEETKSPVKEVRGDGLAHFIVVELEETFDPANDDFPLLSAARYVESAREELEGLGIALLSAFADYVIMDFLKWCLAQKVDPTTSELWDRWIPKRDQPELKTHQALLGSRLLALLPHSIVGLKPYKEAEVRKVLDDLQAKYTLTAGTT